MVTNNNKNDTIKKMLKKFIVFILLFIIICGIAGIYGFLHDQISYTVSSEYFTQLKFEQFNISESIHNRIGAGIVGVKATWWMGLVIGIIIIPLGLIIPNWKNYLRIMLWTFVSIIATALLIGIIALIYGLIKYNTGNLSDFNIPNGVEDKINFCVVGNMHNFSYMGGLFGIIAGIINIIIQNLRIRKISKKI
jgi:hypothetical protein